MAFGEWRNNAELIADVARLGYLRDDDHTLDPTFGLGRFWSIWKPKGLIASDLLAERSEHSGHSVDARDMPWPDDVFDAVVLDPPYKLNGTTTGEGVSGSDDDYGVGGDNVRWQDRNKLCLEMIDEATRVLKPKGVLLVKCMAQVVSGKVCWQDQVFTRRAENLGHRLVDRFDMVSYRPQPTKRRQVHARRNHSTLLVFRLER